MSNEYLDMLQPGAAANADAADPSKNEYLGMLTGAAEQRRQAQAGQLSQAVGTNPDQYATKRKVAGYLGYPTAAVEALPQLEQQAKVQQVQQDTARAPVLAKRFTEADFAKLAHDDSFTLATVETAIAKAARYLMGADERGGFQGAVHRGYLNSGEAAAGFFRGVLDIAAGGLDAATGGGKVGGNPVKGAANFFGDIAREQGAIRDRLYPQIEDVGNLRAGVDSGVESGVQNLKYAPLALLGPAGIAAAMTGMVAETGGQTYQKDTEKGLPIGTAVVHASANMVAEYTTEKYMGAAGLLSRIAGGSGAGRLAMYEITREVPGEIAATIWQNYNEWALTQPEKSLRDFVSEQPDAIAQTIVATLVGGGVQIGASRASMKVAQQIMGREFETVRAAQDAEALQAQLKAALDSKLRERTPDEFRAFVQQVADAHPNAPQNVYVDAEVLNQLSPEVQQLLPGQVLEQMGAALAANDTVAIPVADVLAIAPGTPLEQMVVEHGRIGDPMLPSQAETKAAGEKAGEWLNQEAQRVVQQAQDQQAMQESSERVKQALLDQLNSLGRFRQAVNEGYATLTAAFYTTMAGRLGITPGEMAARYPLRIGGTMGQNEALSQISPEQALETNVPLELPADPLFGEAVGNTPGAQVTDKGLLLDLVRFQKPEQEGAQAIRTGVFYLPAGSANAKYYKAGKTGYGGPEKYQGPTLLRRPLFVRGATGGKAPEAAWEALKGKGSMKALDQAVMSVVTSRSAFRGDSALLEEKVQQFLQENGGEPGLAYEIIQNSKQGNTLRYALQEHVIAHAVRAAGYDAVVGYSKGKAGASISEVFDVREQTYPSNVLNPEIHEVFNQRAVAQETGQDQANSLNDARVSPRLPTAKKATEDALGDTRLQPDLETAKRDPAIFEHNIGLMLAYPNFQGLGGTTEERAESIIQHAVDNLLWLHDRWAPKYRERSRMWYVGGNRIAHRWAKQFGVTPEQVAAVIAATSPQKDWFQNVSLAERILDAVIYNANKPWDAKMTELVKSRDWGKKEVKNPSIYEGKTLQDLFNSGTPGALLDMAIWIRAWDEANNPMKARVITPEGGFTDKFDAGKSGKEIGLRWQSFPTIVKTLQVLMTNDRAVLSEIIGANHKVRSFYNNIIAPYAGDDVTIDTHAVAAALLRPLGSSSTEVFHNFGSGEPGSPGPKNSAITGLYGTYAIYAEAYRRAAAQRGILPREMQSITWEAVRGLFRPEQKNEKIRSESDRLWAAAASGEISAEDARQSIEKLVGGIVDPAWVGSPAGTNEAAAADSSYASELPEARRAEGTADGRGGVDAAASVQQGGQTDGVLNQANFGDGLAWENTTENMITAEIGGGLVVAIYADPEDKGAGAQLSVLNDDAVDQIQPLQFKSVGEAMQAAPHVLSALGGAGTGVGPTLQQPARGTFNPSTLELALSPNADLSTFLHETGHFYLEVMADLASQPNAPAEIAQDMQTLLAWFGIKGTEQVGGTDAGGTLAQGAYHGTPHRGIDKFSTDKIGTGEGNQAYGWGLYFAGRREIAEHYRNTLSGKLPAGWSDKFPESARGYIRVMVGEVAAGQETAKRAAKLVQYANANMRSYPLDQLARELDEGATLVKGQLYEVEIPEDSDMLLWDKPLSEQSDAVRKATLEALRVIKNPDPAYSDEKWLIGFDATNYDQSVNAYATKREAQAAMAAMTGRQLYVALEPSLGPRGASMFLAERGIKGIKYLDGSHNYVVFSGDDVAIKGQFYQGGPTPAGGPVQPKRTPLETWNSMTLEQKRAHHERFAESFEQYLIEGKAPSLELQPLFRRVRAWMLSVYKSLQSFVKGNTPGPELSPEVRQVFDRLLASQEQIAQTEEATGLLPDEEATAEAEEKLAARSLRDLKWAAGAVGKEVKKLQAQAKALRAETKAEVTAEVDAMPEFQAQAALKAAEAEHEAHPTSADFNAAVIADSFGFPSVDAMYRAIDKIGSKADLIEARTTQRMLEEHGDLVDERAVHEAAQQAVHNQARAKSLATELKAQAEMLGARKDTGETNAKGSRITVNALAEAAKMFGAKVVANTPLRDLKAKAWQHTAAERRAGARWQAATAAGKTQEAVKAKQDQVLNNAAAKAAMDAMGEAKKILEFFKRVVKDGNEKTVEKGRDPDVVNTARAVLAAYGVGGQMAKSALDYLALVEKNDPAMYQALQPSLQGALNAAQPLQALTFEQLQALHEEVQAMWHLSKRSRQMEVEGDLMDIEDAADELHARLEAVGIPLEAPGTTSAMTKKEERARWLQFAGSLLRRTEQWAEGMDGKFGGPFRRLVFQPVKAAADRYRADRTVYRKAYQALLDAVAPSMQHKLIEAPELGYTFGKGHNGIGHAELLHALLHTGNESNKRKLLLGRKWATENADGTLNTERWDAFINRMHDTGVLGKVHYDFAQGVWDLLEKTKPLAQKTHRDVFGRYFDEVAANAFDTPFGSYRGGYVPAQADPRIVQDADLRALANLENENMAFSFPAANKGFTKGRVEYNRPLMLDLRTLAQHLDKVLLFAHMEPAVRDVNKLLSQKAVSQPLGKIDPTVYSGMLVPWLNRAARQVVETPIAGDGGVSRVLSVLRARAGAALMFANLSNTIQQVTGFSGAFAKLKADGLESHMLRTTAAFIASPKKMIATVAASSSYMSERMDNEIAAINDSMKDILLDPSLYEKAQAWSLRHSYFLQSALDNTMGPIIWTAGYNAALEKGMTDEQAVSYADGLIRQTQGSTLPEDVSRIETGPAYARMFTQFVGYFNLLANTNATALKQIAGEVGLKKGAGKALGVVFFGLLMPLWIAEAIAQAFKGGPDHDEDKDSYLYDWLAAVFGMGTIKGAFAMVPFVGQLANAGINTWNKNPADDRMSLSPAVSLLESAVSAPHSVYKAIVEDGSKAKAVKDVATAVSVATGLPAAALARPIGYGVGVAEGKIEPVNAADAVRGAITGVASPPSKVK